MLFKVYLSVDRLSLESVLKQAENHNQGDDLRFINTFIPQDESGSPESLSAIDDAHLAIIDVSRGGNPLARKAIEDGVPLILMIRGQSIFCDTYLEFGDFSVIDQEKFSYFEFSQIFNGWITTIQAHMQETSLSA